MASKDYWIEKHNFEGEIPEYLSKDLIDEISAHLIRPHKPINITLQLTTYCNYYCPMCPWHSKESAFTERYYQKYPYLKQIHMPLDKAKRIVDEIVDYGIEQIGLTPQGEFFLYPYWEEFLRYTTQKGIGVSLTTNGSLLDEACVQKLKPFKIDILCVSVDTLEFELFEKIRSDKKKSFERTLTSPFLLHELNTYTQINFIKQGCNDHELENVLEKYKEARINQICVADEVMFDDALLPQNTHAAHPVSLCEGFGEYIIQTDGNVVACCFMASHPKILNEHAPNIYEKSLEMCLDILKESFLKDKLNGFCLTCPTYRTRMIDKTSMGIYNGYFTLSNKGLTRYFKIPDKLASLDDEILLFMYQNHIVTQMKQAGIL